ncbi:putative Transcription initiation factor IIB [groundwater metagenome]|uniref:Transcription initiation factor IIB n=1 Tax=groundwater metagenome TaxID=717931 RepID=A0A098EAR8_9ZZZZ
MEESNKKMVEKLKESESDVLGLEQLRDKSLKTHKPATEEKKDEENYVYRYVCPNCKSSLIVTDKKHGEIRCDKCGMILEEQIISPEKEWRTFNDDVSGIQRANGSTKDSLWDKGLSTKVGVGHTDTYGVPIPTRTKITQSRINKLQNRNKLVNTKDRNFVLVLSKVDRVLNNLSIGNNMEYMKDECAHIYKNAMEKELTKGKNYQGMAAAVIYVLCKVHKIPFQFIDICKAADVTRQLAWKYIKNMQPVIAEMSSDKVNTIPEDKSQNNVNNGIRSIPEDYLGKFADRWNLPPDVETKAGEILKSVVEKGILSGRSPAGFAAAALYLAAKEKNMKVKLSLIKEVKYLTLKNKIKLLENSL